MRPFSTGSVAPRLPVLLDPQCAGMDKPDHLSRA
jgi:hypothetical protein